MADIVEKLHEYARCAETRDEIEMCDEAIKEIERLREALKPFAGMSQHCEGMSDSESQYVFVGDLRAARKAIREGANDE